MRPKDAPLHAWPESEDVDPAIDFVSTGET